MTVDAQPWPMVPVPGLPAERVTQLHLDQRTKGGPPGDCLRAALASLLGAGILDVPHFAAIDLGVDDGPDMPDHANRRYSWWWAMVGWLGLNNIDVVQVDPWLYPDPAQDADLGGCYLLTGKSPRGAFNHCVVAREGQVVWDPHPSRAGLASRALAEVLVRRDGPRPRLLGGCDFEHWQMRCVLAGGHDGDHCPGSTVDAGCEGPCYCGHVAGDHGWYVEPTSARRAEQGGADHG